MSLPAASGVVEGFYGTPWSFAERAALVDVLSEVGLGALVVAPKDDPIHRAAWQRPLDHEASRGWAALFERGARADVVVSFGINPEPTLASQLLRRERANTRTALARKVKELVGLGARGFSMGFDDTLPTLFSAMLTRERGREHGDLADVVRDAAPEARVVVIPAPYFGDPGRLGDRALAYFQGIASRAVPPPCAWTGRDVLSRWITGGDVRRLEEATGAPVVVWDNEIANDWLPVVTGERVGRKKAWTMLSFGPVSNLAADVPERAAGILLNGAREPWLTRVSARTLAAFVSDPARYDRRRAHHAALVAEYGEAAARPMTVLFDLCSYRQKAFRHREVFPDAPTEIVALEALAKDLDRALGDHPVVREIAPALERIGLLVRAASGVTTSAERRALARATRAVRIVLVDARVEKRGRR